MVEAGPVPMSVNWQNNRGSRAAGSACINKTRRRNEAEWGRLVRCTMGAAGGSQTLVVLEDKIHLLKQENVCENSRDVQGSQQNQRLLYR
jgi:hypothetical protein